jgi:AcrR family transcriptional regulator
MPRRPGSSSTKKSGKAASSTPDVRERILDRTIYLTGKMGTTDVPVRAIAREAGVNVAAVNYYFSSKEQMLAQMAERFLSGFEGVMEILERRDVGPEQRLRLWAGEVMRNLGEYPGILSLMERQMAAEPLDAFGEALRSATQRTLRQLTATLREMIGGKDESLLAFKLTLLISALAGPFPRQVERGPERRGFRAPSHRERFLDLLIEHLRQ